MLMLVRHDVLGEGLYKSSDDISTLRTAIRPF